MMRNRPAEEGSSHLCKLRLLISDSRSSRILTSSSHSSLVQVLRRPIFISADRDRLHCYTTEAIGGLC